MIQKLSDWYRNLKAARALDALVRTTVIGIPAEVAFETFRAPQVAHAQQITEAHLNNLIERIKGIGDRYDSTTYSGGKSIVYNASGYIEFEGSQVHFRYEESEAYRRLQTKIELYQDANGCTLSLIIDDGFYTKIDGLPDTIGIMEERQINSTCIPLSEHGFRSSLDILADNRGLDEKHWATILYRYALGQAILINNDD